MKGSVIKYERDNIDTDVIIPGTYLKIHDYNELAKHAMEGIDPEYHSKVKEGVKTIDDMTDNVKAIDDRFKSFSKLINLKIGRIN